MGHSEQISNPLHVPISNKIRPNFYTTCEPENIDTYIFSKTINYFEKHFEVKRHGLNTFYCRKCF